MKKTLIALAVLAASGAALAQSSVTTYGRVDVWFGSVDDGTNSVTKLDSNGLTTSRLGFKGSEDLGGGLKANFQLEHRLNPDSGTENKAGVFWHGASWVGLSGGFGEVKAGRMLTSFDDVRALSNKYNVFDSNVTPTGDVYKRTNDYSSRVNNMAMYNSPAMGGFSVGLTYAPDEDATTSADTTAVALMYKAGKLQVGLGYQDQKTKDFTEVAAAYDFGVAAVSGGYSKAGGDASAAKNGDRYNVGVTVPFGATKVSLGYATAENDNGDKYSGWTLGVGYSLSKRTRAYAGLRQTQVKDGSGTKTADTRLFAIGMRHDF